MKLISQTDFAVIAGLSRQGINKIVNSENELLTLVKTKKKRAGKNIIKIDLDGYLTAEFLAGKNVKEIPDQIPEKKRAPRKIRPIKPKNIPENPYANQQEAIIPTTPTSRSQKKSLLEIQKLEEGNEKIRIDNEKKRGALIPKILIKRVFGRLYSIFENQLKSLGVNISPKISAIYGEANQTKTLEILGVIKRSGDKLLQSEINKILNTGEPDRILEMNSMIEDSVMVIIKAIQREFDKFLKNIKKLGE